MPDAAAAKEPFLIAAVTGRALAASAVRGGHPVVVLDYFGDRDTRSLAREIRVVRSPRGLRFDRKALLAAAALLAPPGRCRGVVYGSGFEGRAGLLVRLAAGRKVYGNSARTIAAVKDPRRLFPLLGRLGIRHPEVRLAPPADPAGWLVKHPAGAGGVRVRPAGREPAPRGSFFQRLEQGRIMSVLFLADGSRARIVGRNEQWTSPARPELPFLYGGAVGGVGLPAEIESDLGRALDALVRSTRLVGLNGIDFLLTRDGWSLLEVNPRPTATLDLYDADYSTGLFDCHLRACEGELPDQAAPSRASRAHAIVHTPLAWEVGARFQFPDWCRDLPWPETAFAPGDPVCSVHAEAADPERAVALLRERQQELERAIIEDAAAAVRA